MQQDDGAGIGVLPALWRRDSDVDDPHGFRADFIVHWRTEGTS